MTMFAKIIDGVIERQSRRPPEDDDGWAEVVDTPHPGDSPEVVHYRTVEMVNGTPTHVWHSRPRTPDEPPYKEPELSLKERLTMVEAELREMKKRAATVQTYDTDATKIRDAIVGKPEGVS